MFGPVSCLQLLVLNFRSLSSLDAAHLLSDARCGVILTTHTNPTTLLRVPPCIRQLVVRFNSYTYTHRCEGDRGLCHHEKRKKIQTQRKKPLFRTLTTSFPRRQVTHECKYINIIWEGEQECLTSFKCEKSHSSSLSRHHWISFFLFFILLFIFFFSMCMSYPSGTVLSLSFSSSFLLYINFHFYQLIWWRDNNSILQIFTWFQSELETFMWTHFMW